MKRIYVVKEGDNAHLVAAATPAQARGHIARKIISVAIPTPAELVSLTKAGVEVQEAGEEPATAAA